MKELLNTVSQTDALTLLGKLESNSVDIIFTDPAYWTLDKWRNMGTTTRLGGHRLEAEQNKEEWFQTITEKELYEILGELFRVLKPNKHALVMSDGQTLKYLLNFSEQIGFSYCKPLVWDKVNQGMGYHFRTRHEFIVLFDKGKNQKPKNLGLPDIITVPMLRGGYPTEKPVGLAKLFIEQYTQTGDTVLDPFCGSGSTLVAAKLCGCTYIGGDVSARAVELSSSRLTQTGLFENSLVTV